MPKIVIYITSLILFLGILPMPYGYYTLLRIVACIVFVWASVISYERRHSNLTWIFVLFAIAFNPIIKIFLPKEIWMFLDAFAGIMLILFRNSIVGSTSRN